MVLCMWHTYLFTHSYTQHMCGGKKNIWKINKICEFLDLCLCFSLIFSGIVSYFTVHALLKISTIFAIFNNVRQKIVLEKWKKFFRRLALSSINQSKKHILFIKKIALKLTKLDKKVFNHIIFRTNLCINIFQWQLSTRQFC